ncbi:MAG: sigma-70 family RNA polymerase sigma factor, partial [Candidatus Krumholzibacteria bacterium]|nr:sigma-70 family RNA polymerase sigma factor [Candidatus Krumholzibacteria bacterium]
MEDDILIQRAKEGDSDAFRQLVERYKGEIYNYFIRSTGSIEDSEDLTQQCFVNLYNRLDRYRRTASLRTFIYRIATNLAISFSRKRKSPVSLDLLVEGGYDPVSRSSTDHPEDLVYARELQKAYLEALVKLPVEWSLILDLRIGKELAYKEIADLVGRSISSVESILFRAREKLTEEMAPYLRGN